MPGIGMISNPHSRRNRRHPEQMRRLAYILGKNDNHELTNRVEDVSDAARQFRDNDIDILALNGGDGTNHVTLTKCIEVWGDTALPKIALLRGGTMNTASNAVGVKGTPPRILANLVEKYYTNQPFETTERDLIKVNDSGQARYGFIFGMGMVANFLEVYYETGNPSPTVAARLLAEAIATMPFGGGELTRRLFRPIHAHTQLDDGQWPTRDYTTILASTVDQVGLGFRPFIRSEETPGTFHLLGVTSGAVDTTLQLPKIRLGLPVDQDAMRSAVSRRAEFQCGEPVSYTIDGDMHVADDGCIELEAGPRMELIIK